MTLAIDAPALARDATWRTVDDLVHALGDIPPNRIRLRPTPGTATASDMIRMVESKQALVELIDGTLVEKAVGQYEDAIGCKLGLVIGNFVEQRQLGIMNGSQGMTTMIMGNVRMPDVAFTQKGRITYAQMRAEAAPSIAPDLWVEVLSPTNTPHEMLKKRRELFASGTCLIWEFEPADRTVAVYTSAEQPDAVLDATAMLTGGDVLPGFTLALAPFWAQFDD